MSTVGIVLIVNSRNCLDCQLEILLINTEDGVCRYLYLRWMGAIFVLFLLSTIWNFFQKTSNITTNVYLYINISNITTNIYLSLCDQDSAMPKSNSSLHHSIECAQIDNSTLLKIENW